ncbi:hypothetical protein CPSG_03323 [Coccidioides posadasii str. Silveira]|uniref:Uncharacterized protein n=1 Tax=Coccidioides posadasii (strain RMSCC 757 / Silveira) TaxID=443226 RepID=E9CZP5_COCPS|nr:hypothetical protein CPSG_03323 [Coccidioides posadasii str. Silveira]
MGWKHNIPSRSPNILATSIPFCRGTTLADSVGVRRKVSFPEYFSPFPVPLPTQSHPTVLTSVQSCVVDIRPCSPRITM